MFNVGSYNLGSPNRYSAKNNLKPINFLFLAPEAKHVSILGDFNNWSPNANPLKKGPDGGWSTQVPLKHGHHRYVFLVDGVRTLDPRAQGVSRDDNNERVSLMAVS
jgi:1,4-alpha-glucan branching enzyme